MSRLLWPRSRKKRGVTYSLRDMFTTDRAAGAVNGTSAEPTGQTRTVTDTNNKLSITGGLVDFATGGVGAGNPGIWYPSMTTVLGTVLLGTIVPGSTSSAGSIGWDTTAAGIIQNALSLITGSALQAIAAGTGVSVGLYTNGAAYTIVIIQRTNGFWFLIKGGTEYTAFNLVWFNVTGAAGSWLPAAGVSTGTIGIFTADDIRIPTNLYIPAPLAYDTFTRANGALGSTETTGPDAQALTALAWAFTAGIWTVATNKAVGTPVPGSDLVVNGGFAADTNWTKGSGWAIAAGVATATAASSNLNPAVDILTTGQWYQCTFDITAYTSGTLKSQFGGIAGVGRVAIGTYTDTGRASSVVLRINAASATGSVDNVICKQLTLAELFSSVSVSTPDIIASVSITRSGASDGFQSGLVLNLDSTSSPANFILVYFDGKGSIQVDECVAGVYTSKETTAVTYSAGAELVVKRRGTELRKFYNGALVGSTLTMIANTNAQHGLFSTSNTNSFDNFTLWAVGTSGEYESALNSL